LERIALAGSCDAVVERALFADLATATDTGSGGALFVSGNLALFVLWSHFDSCEAENAGGAVYAQANGFQMNDTCISHCYAKSDGQFLYNFFAYMVSIPAVCDHCSFYASYRKGEQQSDSTGDGIRVIAGDVLTYYFRDDNYTRSDSAAANTAVFHCDTSLCIVNRRFSTFERCREAFVLRLASGGGSWTFVEYTNFLWDNVTGAIMSSSIGCPVRHCVFAGNSAPITFDASATGPFEVSNCVFDVLPSGACSTTMVDIVAPDLITTIAIDEVTCFVIPNATATPTSTRTCSLTASASASQMFTASVALTASELRTAFEPQSAGGSRINLAVIVAPIVVVVIVAVAVTIVLCRHRRHKSLSETEYQTVDEWMMAIRVE
jgi:hypothetical protein